MSLLFVAAALGGSVIGRNAIPSLRAVVWPLMASSPETSLDFSPNELSGRDVVSVILLLIIKSLGQKLGLWACQTVTTQVDTATPDTARPTLAISGPRLAVRMPLNLKAGDLQKFARALGKEAIDVAGSAELTTLFLSAVTEPAMLLLLGKRQSPVKPLGSVNVCNELRILEPKLCLDLLAMRLEGTAVLATLAPRVRAVKRGYEYDLEVEILAGEARTVIYSQTFTMLEFAKHGLEVESSAQPVSVEQLGGEESSFSMAPKDPLRWAALCKDYNPIHVSTIGAKVFGMRGRIAHGNHVVAQAVLSSSLSLEEGKPPQRPSRMLVSFRRPVALPASLSVHSVSQKSRNRREFQVLQKGKVCVEGHSEDVDKSK